jgi:hypothetical protein
MAKLNNSISPDRFITLFLSKNKGNYLLSYRRTKKLLWIFYSSRAAFR